MAEKISHLGYDEVTVRVGSNQMISEDELPYITNDRRVLFTLSDGVSAGREIYVVIDDQLQGPLRNGQALETGVEFWERFLPMPHTGGIYVVDTKPFPVNFTDNLEVPVLQSNGQVLNVKTNVVFSAQMLLENTFFNIQVAVVKVAYGTPSASAFLATFLCQLSTLSTLLYF